MAAKARLQDWSNNSEVSEPDLLSLETKLPRTVQQLTSTYADLSKATLLHGYNPRFSGGLLSCVPDGDGRSNLLLHARGRNLDRLALTRATPSDSNLVASETLAEVRLEKTFEVQAALVQEQVYVATRHGDSCAMFSVSDSSFHSLGSCRFDEEKTAPTSICLSPYVAGEVLLCAQGGIVQLWDVSKGLQTSLQVQPRFECRDTWCHAYYASHPRQLVLTDRTCAQMRDHRDGFRNSVDLFALPSNLVGKQECIMRAHLHGKGSPLHIVATSHCVFVVDQRFAGAPVFQWHPDLKGPLQYLASADYNSSGQSEGVVAVGCQHPPEVMCYPISHGDGNPVTMTMNPWRLSRMSDIGSESCAHFWDSSCLLHSFQERLDLSLAGLAVAQGSRPRSLVFYQSDAYGELFFQKYGTPHNRTTATKTGVPYPGQKDFILPDDVRDHTQSWLQKLQQQVDSVRKVKKRGHVRRNRIARNCRKWMLKSSQGEDRTDGGGGDGGNSEGLQWLDGVVPPVDSYQKDAYTQVHLSLLKGDEDPVELVKTREEHRSSLLSRWKERNRAKRKLATHSKSHSPSSPLSPGDSRTLNEHHTFYSLEHQKENTLINDLLSNQAKPQLPKTVSMDRVDGDLAKGSDIDNTPLTDVSESENGDPFAPSEESVAKSDDEEPLHYSLNRGDDDDFFNSQDLFLSFSQSGTFG